MKYIIVQAGGKGTRLGYLTKNKPKTLVPVENLPMIFHLFRMFPEKEFIIIADYKKEILREYLASFAEVKYQVIDANGVGTCAGINQAIHVLPEKEPFMLVWSDLLLKKDFKLPEEYAENKKDTSLSNYVGLSEDFQCRWKYKDGEFVEDKSTKFGVAGLFLFGDKSNLGNVPESGEFVRWLQTENKKFNSIGLAGTKEFGILEEYNKLEEIKTRPFNRIFSDGEILTKEPIDEQGKNLAKWERNWYRKAQEKQINGIPRIYKTEPLQMEYIRGRNIYEGNFSFEKKQEILEMLVETLKKLHSVASVPADRASMKEAYFNKTMQRLYRIQNLVPWAREPYICVNGRKCRNVFFNKDKLEKALNKLQCEKFSFIHGDCTFSNLMLRDTNEPVLIDPRGYFGSTELFGDERYDWAKLYYSIVGNYDRFNLKKFSLDIGGHSVIDNELIKEFGESEVRIEIESNGWEALEGDFFDLIGGNPNEIKLLHAVIWLSFTTYTWHDFDSVCGAFYNGLYYLEEVL